MALAVAIGYDWLYGELTDEQRATVRGKLIDYAVKPSIGKYHNEGNKNQVCNSGIICAAIAAFEEDPQLCSSVIMSSLESNKTAVQGIYNPDGNYYEGYGYWTYGTDYQVVLLQTLQKVFGTTYGIADIPGFRKTGEFMLYMNAPGKKCFPYADGGDDNSSAQFSMWYLAALTNNPGLLYHELKYVLALKESQVDRGVMSGSVRLLPMALCFMNDIPFAIPDDDASVQALAPKAKIWTGSAKNTPVAMVRSSWGYTVADEENDCYVGIKGGVSNISHAHLDAGSFVFDCNGERWSDDLKRPDYGKAEEAMGSDQFWGLVQNALRWDMIRINNLGHSTISFWNNDDSVPGKLHPCDHCVSEPALFTQVFDSPDKLGVTIDMNGPLKGQVRDAKRTITLENGNELHIVDAVTALSSDDAQMEWRMITDAGAVVSDSGILLTKTASGKQMALCTSVEAGIPLKYFCVDEVRHMEWAPKAWTSKYSDEDDEQSGYHAVGFTAKIPAGTTAVFTTILSNPSRQEGSAGRDSYEQGFNM